MKQKTTTKQKLQKKKIKNNKTSIYKKRKKKQDKLGKPLKPDLISKSRILRNIWPRFNQQA